MIFIGFIFSVHGKNSEQVKKLRSSITKQELPVEMKYKKQTIIMPSSTLSNNADKVPNNFILLRLKIISILLLKTYLTFDYFVSDRSRFVSFILKGLARRVGKERSGRFVQVLPLWKAIREACGSDFAYASL